MTVKPILLALSTLIVLFAAGANAQTPKKPASSPAKPPSGKNDKEKPKEPEKPKADPAQKAKGGKDDLITIDGELYTKEEKEKLDKGWKRLDYDWIAPEEASNIDKGKFKINNAWVTLDEADKYHANEATPWSVPIKHFAYTTNIPREQIIMLSKYAEQSYATLKDITGVEPKIRLGVRVFNNVESANEYAKEYAKEVRESHHSSLFPGYVADGEKDRPAIVLFDGGPGKGFAHIYMAHAAAHKFIDAALPDPNAIPEWFNEGLATYCDRYLEAQLRPWAFSSLVKRGGIDKLSTFVKNFKTSVDDDDAVTKSQTKFQQAGLIVGYYMLGGDKADETLFKKTCTMLSKPKEQRDAAIDKLLDNPDVLEKKIKKFAGF
ncbi:MAG: hypothetical protein HY286_11455 [Planctomycetes bacterium]|nr:hypothetical protein [Planctomycetota bacterium]